MLTPAMKKGGKFTLVVIFLAGLTLGAAVPWALGYEPHMVNALKLLRDARGELVQATPNKAGHRERAIALVDRAIGQVEKGIAVSQ
ncbi:MAG: hypothetical protein ACLQUW_16585 [Desulfobaccales bacterium]